MKKFKIVNIVLLAVISLSTIGLTGATIYLSKERQSNFHYINSEEGLKSINNDLSGHYIINASEFIHLSSNWVPIGDKDHPFTGTLDGNYKAISGIKYSKDYVIEKANKGEEVLLGLFANNQGTIKHLTLSFDGFIDEIGEDQINKDFNITVGHVAAINSGYISMVSFNTPTHNFPSKAKNVVFGGITGKNYKQVRCCSVNSHLSLKGSQNVISGAFIGINYTNTVVEYCVREGYQWNTFEGDTYIVSQFIGLCRGGKIDNICIGSGTKIKDYNVWFYPQFKSNNSFVGVLTGKIECDENIEISNIYFDIGVSTSIGINGFGEISSSIISKGKTVSTRNLIYSGQFSTNSSIDKNASLLFGSIDNKDLFSNSNSCFYNFRTSFSNFAFEGIKEETFSNLVLKTYSFDEACWIKGDYGLTLDYGRGESNG